MINRFMVSVAALALIAGTGFANAQGTGVSRENPSAGSAAQPGASSSDHSKMNRNAAEPSNKSTQSEQKSTQTEQKSPNAGKNQRSEENTQGQNSKSISSENDHSKAGKDMKAEGREGRNAEKKGMTEQQKNATEQRGATENRSQTTVGQAGAGAKLSDEQRTKITTVIRDEHVAPAENVNFSISVGTRVPRDMRFHPLPREIVSIYPDWRGYEFFLVRDEIVVVNPQTLEIVAVLPA